MLKYKALRREKWITLPGMPGGDMKKENVAMLNLQEVKNGEICTVTWMLGEVAEEIRKTFDLQEADQVQMVRNMGKSGVIVRYRNHRLAMDPSAAFAIKVEASA